MRRLRSYDRERFTVRAGSKRRTDQLPEVLCRAAEPSEDLRNMPNGQVRWVRSRAWPLSDVWLSHRTPYLDPNRTPPPFLEATDALQRTRHTPAAALFRQATTSPPGSSTGA